MEEINEQLAMRSFENYMESARRAEADGWYNRAKRDYYKAAEIMLSLAKISTTKLRAVRLERAKRIIATADELPEQIAREAKAPVVRNNGGQNADNEEGREFAAAEIPNISFADVAGLESVKEAIRIKMIYPLAHPELYTALGKKGGGGVLLYGPPGTGKTMMARATAKEVGAKFYAVKCSDIVSKWVGESEQNIDALFETARKDDRAIIFFDELDSLFYKRGIDVHNDRRVNELLQQIDGFSGKSTNIMLLGATNNPWSVDEAAMRPGRFSQKIYVPLPDAPAREFLIKKALSKIKCDENISISALINATEGYSGADIVELMDRATDFPLNRALQSGTACGLIQADIDGALKRVRPSVSSETVEKFVKYSKDD